MSNFKLLIHFVLDLTMDFISPQCLREGCGHILRYVISFICMKPGQFLEQTFFHNEQRIEYYLLSRR